MRSPYQLIAVRRAGGAWDAWGGEGQKIVSACTIMTTPNDLVKPVHDRMPVILPRECYAE